MTQRRAAATPSNLQIVPPASCTDPGWLSLRAGLWPGVAAHELLRDMEESSARGHFVRLACLHGGNAVGFIEAAQRNDYVNGTSSSPVVFLEELYVEPAARRQGVARALVAEVERWAADRACSELASDSPIGNLVAHAMHRALGFEETERVVYFRRAVRLR
jgi:aminoglycoside 6'-N-acetyltransferase I